MPSYNVGMVQIFEDLHFVENLLFIALDKLLGDNSRDSSQLTIVCGRRGVMGRT